MRISNYEELAKDANALLGKSIRIECYWGLVWCIGIVEIEKSTYGHCIGYEREIIYDNASEELDYEIELDNDNHMNMHEGNYFIVFDNREECLNDIYEYVEERNRNSINAV